MGGPRAGLCWPFTPEAYPPVEIDNLAAASESGIQKSGHGTMSNNTRPRNQDCGVRSKRNNGQDEQQRFTASRVGKPLNLILFLGARKTSELTSYSGSSGRFWASDPWILRGLRGPHSPPANRVWARDPEIFTKIAVPDPP